MSARGSREGDVMRSIWIEAGRMGVVLWRNNVGTFMVDGRPFRAGLCVGSSDLVGMDPRQRGRFVAVEVKTKRGRPTKQQLNYIERVKANGGVAMIARSAEQFRELMEAARAAY